MDYVSRLSMFLLLAVAAMASPAAAGDGVGKSHHADSEEHRLDAHPFRVNTVALFVGMASEGSRDNGVALGLEYEHRFSAAFGIGALAEHTYGDLDTWVLALPFAFHSGPWKFYLAPGMEYRHSHREPMVRLGGEYGFHYGRWEISPQIDVDLVAGEKIYVMGLTFGRGF